MINTLKMHRTFYTRSIFCLILCYSIAQAAFSQQRINSDLDFNFAVGITGGITSTTYSNSERINPLKAKRFHFGSEYGATMTLEGGGRTGISVGIGYLKQKYSISNRAFLDYALVVLIPFFPFESPDVEQIFYRNDILTIPLQVYRNLNGDIDRPLRGFLGVEYNIIVRENTIIEFNESVTFSDEFKLRNSIKEIENNDQWRLNAGIVAEIPIDDRQVRFRGALNLSYTLVPPTAELIKSAFGYHLGLGLVYAIK